MIFSKIAVFSALASTAIATCAKPLIIDTDLLNFDDDPLAIGIANIFQSWGEAEILGIVSSISAQYAPPAIDAIDTFYGHGDIPVAIQKPVTNITQDPNYTEYGDYITGLTFDFPEDIRNGANTTDPKTLYRSILSAAADSSVTIVVIGDFDNIYHLFLSEADSISPLTGLELITLKVAELVIQGAAYGSSFNLYNHNTTFAETVLDAWPTTVALTFVGSNIGSETLFGARLTTELDLAVNPVAYAFNKSVGYNVTHKTWDATAMYYAIRGLDDVYAYNFTGGRVVADDAADTTWIAYNETLENAVIWKEDGIGNASFAERLEDILLWQPGEDIPQNLVPLLTCVGNASNASAAGNVSATSAIPSATASYAYSAAEVGRSMSVAGWMAVMAVGFYML